MRRQTRSPEDCLKADAGLARLAGHAARLLRLQQAFEAATPLSRGARIANLRLGMVVIHAANGAVAAKLRQIAPTLVGVLSHVAPEITGIGVRVQPRNPGSTKPARTSCAVIGEKQKRGLASLAASLPKGSTLRNALDRLVDQAK